MRLLIGGYEFERRADGYWRRSSKADHSTTAEILVDWRVAALDRIAELEPLARFGRDIAETWRGFHPEDSYGDMDDDTITNIAKRSGVMVTVAAGTHLNCEWCDDGAKQCRELRLP